LWAQAAACSIIDELEREREREGERERKRERKRERERERERERKREREIGKLPALLQMDLHGETTTFKSYLRQLETKYDYNYIAIRRYV
jgi:hypothetical protein